MDTSHQGPLIMRAGQRAGLVLKLKCFLLPMLECAAIALAFCFAMLSPTLDFANGSVPSYGGTLLYFMGYLISLKDIPVWWIWYSYLDFLRFTFVGLMTNEFKVKPKFPVSWHEIIVSLSPGFSVTMQSSCLKYDARKQHVLTQQFAG